MNMDTIHSVGVDLGTFGIGGSTYTSAQEGLIHEVAHVAAIQMMLGYGGDEGLSVILGAHDLNPLNDWMNRVYLRHLRIPNPQWIHGSYYVWDEDTRASRKFYDFGDRLEVYAQAATYLVLLRQGIEHRAEDKFIWSQGGPNNEISNYVTKCLRALRDPKSSAIADLTEEMISLVLKRFAQNETNLTSNIGDLGPRTR